MSELSSDIANMGELGQPNVKKRGRRHHRHGHERRRCPFCRRHLCRRSKPAGAFESCLLLILLRPFKCRGCRARNYGFLFWERMAWAPSQVRFFLLAAAIVALTVLLFFSPFFESNSKDQGLWKCPEGPCRGPKSATRPEVA